MAALHSGLAAQALKPPAASAPAAAAAASRLDPLEAEFGQLLKAPIQPLAKAVQDPLDEEGLRRILEAEVPRLASPYPEVREEATGALARAYEDVADPSLRNLFWDERTLAGFGADFQDPEVRGRIEFVRVYGRAGILEERLSKRCSEENPGLAVDIYSLQGEDLRRLIFRFVPSRKKPGDPIRFCGRREAEAIAEALLERMAREGSSPALERSLAFLTGQWGLRGLLGEVSRLLLTPDAEVRVEALAAMRAQAAACEAYAPMIAEALSDPEPLVRAQAARALVRVRPVSESAAAIAGLLGDEDPGVRTAALEGMRALGLRALALEPAVRRLMESDPEPSLRRLAEQALRAMRG